MPIARIAPSRDVAKLCPCVRDKWERLVDILEGDDIYLSTISVLRTKEEQAGYVKGGTSWTMASKHLPQPPKGLSLAIDVCPVPLLTMKNWAPTSPLWEKVGEAAVEVGLRWGVWRKDKQGVLRNIDKAHLYLSECKCVD
jgi:hypothetical protein